MAQEAIASATIGSACNTVNIVADGVGAAEAILAADALPLIT